MFLEMINYQVKNGKLTMEIESKIYFPFYLSVRITRMNIYNLNLIIYCMKTSVVDTLFIRIASLPSMYGNVFGRMLTEYKTYMIPIIAVLTHVTKML